MEGGVYVSYTLFKDDGHLTKISLKMFKEGLLSVFWLIYLVILPKMPSLANRLYFSYTVGA